MGIDRDFYHFASGIDAAQLGAAIGAAAGAFVGNQVGQNMDSKE